MLPVIAKISLKTNTGEFVALFVLLEQENPRCAA
jgi:hypothetical protein